MQFSSFMFFGKGKGKWSTNYLELNEISNFSKSIQKFSGQAFFEICFRLTQFYFYNIFTTLVYDVQDKLAIGLTQNDVKIYTTNILYMNIRIILRYNRTIQIKLYSIVYLSNIGVFNTIQNKEENY